jgi:hypothetical protein
MFTHAFKPLYFLIILLSSSSLTNLVSAWPNPEPGTPCPSNVVGSSAVYDSQISTSGFYFGGGICYDDYGLSAEASSFVCDAPASGLGSKVLPTGGVCKLLNHLLACIFFFA